MKSIYIGIGYFLISMIVACKKDWLAEKAIKNQAIPATINDFQLLLNNEAFNEEYCPALAELASDGHYTSEAAWAASSSDAAINAYTWRNSRPYPEFYWGLAYSPVFNANVVLDAASAYKPANAEGQYALNSIRGQALVHRAFAFYRIAQIWAPPYNKATAGSELGIPLRLDADATLPSVRSTVEQTYNQIVNDLLEAKTLLSADFIAKTRVNKRTAFALLSRVYLSMREYDEAGAYADSALKINKELMNYSTLSVTANFIGNVNNNPEVLFFIAFYTSGTSNFLTTTCFIDEQLYNSYETDDLRKLVFFRKNANNTITYKGNYNSTTSRLFCGLANDELYLTRAESYARSGNTTLAMKDLNDLLRSRWAKNTDGTTRYIDQDAANSTDALNKILIERKKQLLMRGLRWTDLRRLNLEDEHKITLTRTIGGNTYTLEPGSFRYTFPISQSVLSKTAIQQNVDWD